MKHRLLAIGMVAAVASGAAGCLDTARDNGGQPAEKEPVTAAAALEQAATKLGSTSFEIDAELGAQGRMVGAMDPPNKLGKMTMAINAEGAEMNVHVLLLGSDMYMKMDLGGETLPGMAADKWMHLDIERLPANNSLGLKPGDFDPAGAAKFLRAVATAERVDDNKIKGTIDLTKAEGAGGLDAKDLAGLGDKAKAVPFEATIDGQGRLTALSMEMPAMAGAPAQRVSVTYSDFGTKVEIPRPGADEVTEAPELIYGTLEA